MTRTSGSLRLRSSHGPAMRALVSPSNERIRDGGIGRAVTSLQPRQKAARNGVLGSRPFAWTSSTMVSAACPNHPRQILNSVQRTRSTRSVLMVNRPSSCSKSRSQTSSETHWKTRSALRTFSMQSPKMPIRLLCESGCRMRPTSGIFQRSRPDAAQLRKHGRRQILCFAA